MDRRTDRTVGLVTIIAMALVPAAALGFVRPGAAFDGGTPAETSITPVAEDYPGAPKPLKTKAPPEPAAAPPAPALPVTVPQAPGTTGTPPAQLTSFDRQIGTLRILPTGTEQIQETATFTLKPKFTMKSTSVRSKLNGKNWKKVSTTVVTVKGRVMTTKVGDQPLERETLTKAQLDEMKRQADPRFLTNQIKDLPGINTQFDKKTKIYKHTIDLTAGGNFIQYLPEDVASLIPAGVELLGADLEAYSDTKDHLVMASLNGASTVGAVGIGVIHSNMR
ncbi:hypothetical protein EDD29_7645 [Actinocorallia herbida]|uniref:Uncharacterized protein n=1 Tax=Actinocorallia herbida TaxID=58109 RepID=A0A3N1D8R7_9ACTN|nr:hypothetical protein [Actinocorallia herbida]ROO89934.1 hypothetical protein EDD29_7645 [Actinocorallia herbida]